jgi:hypothetical protein
MMRTFVCESTQPTLRGRDFPQPALRAVDVPDSRSSQGQAQTRHQGARAFGQTEDGGHRFRTCPIPNPGTQGRRIGRG